MTRRKALVVVWLLVIVGVIDVGFWWTHERANLYTLVSAVSPWTKGIHPRRACLAIYPLDNQQYRVELLDPLTPIPDPQSTGNPQSMTVLPEWRWYGVIAPFLGSQTLRSFSSLDPIPAEIDSRLRQQVADALESDPDGPRFAAASIAAYRNNTRHWFVDPLNLFHDAILVPVWLLTFRGALRRLALVRLRVQWERSARVHRCPKCEYDISATPNRCPECGTEVISEPRPE